MSDDAPLAATPAQGPRTGPASPATDPLVGTTLAERYLVLQRIGEGGMGAVYEARHTVLGKRVAVKLLLEKLVGKSELVARLLQEARLASSIGHEHIVDVIDFGTTADGRAFVVMEYLEGESLGALLSREAPLPVPRCLQLARQVASALGAAHEKGIVHRDIKPENVYLVRRGAEDFVKVVDFGVSKAAKSFDEGIEPLRLTRTGTLLGTPLYMSPEQARGDEDVDLRADVWAVGVMLYECLTGDVPFRANNYLRVISQVLTNEAVPPGALRPELGIPEAVDAVVMKALAKNRAHRYQSMRDLEGDLERLIAGDQNVGGPAPSLEGGQRPVATVPGTRWHLAAASLGVLGLGLALALMTPPKAAPQAPKPPLAPAPTAPAVKPPVVRAASAPVAPPETPPDESVAVIPTERKSGAKPRGSRSSERAGESVRGGELGGASDGERKYMIVGGDIAAPPESAYGKQQPASAARGATKGTSEGER